MPIRIFQEDTPIGKIVVENIPDEAGPRRKVHLDIEITAKNSIVGLAKVTNEKGEEVAECKVDIKFPPIPVPELPQLKRDYEELEAQRSDKEELSRDPKERLRLGGPAKNISHQIAKGLDELEPDRQEIFRDLSKLHRLVHPKSDDMDPPQASFFALLKLCRSMVKASEDPQIQAVGQTLDAIESDGTNAAKTKNHREWAVANENLDRQHSKLKKLIEGPEDGGGGGGEVELPPTSTIKQAAEQEVGGLRAKLNAKHADR